MPRKKTSGEALRGKCRHCGGALIYYKPDEQIERYEQLVYRSEKPRWWHTNPDPEKQVAESLYTDTQWGQLGAYCEIKPTRYQTDEELKSVRGQVGEPMEWCVYLKGDWPKVF